MINTKHKLSFLTVALLAFVLGVSGTAHGANFTFSADYTIDLSSPDLDLTIVSGSQADSLVVNTENIQITVAEGEKFTVTVASRGLNVSGDTTSGIANTCDDDGTTGRVVVTGGDAGETITIAPTTGECDSGGGGGGGGSSSGGSSSDDDEDDEEDSTPTAPTAPGKPISEMTPEELQAEIVRITTLISQLQQLIVLQGGTPVAGPLACVPFNTNLYNGMTNNSEVRRLQEFLISKGHLASGYSTGNYLSLTVNAVSAYQSANGIAPAAGYFGPLTRASINAQCSSL